MGGLANLPESPAAGPPEGAAAEPEPESAPPQGDAREDQPEPVDLAAKVAELGLSAKEVRALLDSLPADQRAEAVADIERHGEARAETRLREAEGAEAARSDLYSQHERLGTQAAGWLSQTFDRIDRAKRDEDYEGLAKLVSGDELERHIDAALAGYAAKLARETEAQMKPLRDKWLPNPTPEEKARLEPAIYEDRRSGKQTQIDVLFALALAREGGKREQEGIEKGKADLAASASLADKLAKLAEARNGTAPVVPGGKPPASPKKLTNDDLTADWRTTQRRMREAGERI